MRVKGVIVDRKIDGNSIIYSIYNGKIYDLDEYETCIFDMLQKDIKIDDIISSLGLGLKESKIKFIKTIIKFNKMHFFEKKLNESLRLMNYLSK